LFLEGTFSGDEYLFEDLQIKPELSEDALMIFQIVRFLLLQYTQE
jgi:hypothetical protein